MENPSYWKSAELVILNAYEKWEEAHQAGAIGASLPMTIANALRKSGHINDSFEERIGWDGLRKGLAENG
jgi:hypothetical protein